MASNKVNINIPTPNIDIELVGDWDKAIELPELVVRAMAEGYDKAIRECSRDLIKIVKNAISTGLPPGGSGVRWAPLSPNTIKTHGVHNIYNLTGFYERSIGVHTYKNRVLVGIPLNIRTPGGLTINQLAILLEHGSTNSGGGGIPPRPLWAPAMKSYGGTDKIKKVVLKHLKKSIKEHTGIEPKQMSATW